MLKTKVDDLVNKTVDANHLKSVDDLKAALAVDLVADLPADKLKTSVLEVLNKQSPDYILHHMSSAGEKEVRLPSPEASQDQRFYACEGKGKGTWSSLEH